MATSLQDLRQVNFHEGQMKILIAYDGSDCADAALEDLKGGGRSEALSND